MALILFTILADSLRFNKSTNAFEIDTLTHCGRVTQICVFTLQLCKTDDANLRF